MQLNGVSLVLETRNKAYTYVAAMVDDGMISQRWNGFLTLIVNATHRTSFQITKHNYI